MRKQDWAVFLAASKSETSMKSHSAVPEPAVERIARQIRELQDVQDAVYVDAIYLGMTSEVARECDERRRRIIALTNELIALRSSRPGVLVPEWLWSAP